VLRADRRRIDALRVVAPRDVLPPDERPRALSRMPAEARYGLARPASAALRAGWRSPRGQRSPPRLRR